MFGGETEAVFSHKTKRTYVLSSLSKRPFIFLLLVCVEFKIAALLIIVLFFD